MSKTREEALKEARMQKIMSGAEDRVESKDGYWYLKETGEQVLDIPAFLETVEVDEDYVRQLMNM